MRNLDLTPFQRSCIGFDHFASQLNRATTNAARQQKPPAFPPYNIESLAEEKYLITIAVAGFSKDELEIESEPNNLVVKGTKTKAGAQHQYLHQGIAERDFERKFQLGDYVKVIDATVENGMLSIELVKETPEAMKPRKIAIQH